MARGVHGRQGPAPDPNALKRDRGSDGWVTLPKAGRDGEVPAWPLSEASARESVLWVAEWRRPQATQWEANGQELEVAMYVRTLVAAESPKATAAERTLLLRQQEHLGLSMPGLARNKWRIGEVGPVKQRRQASRSSARARLKVVGDGST